MTGTLCTHSLFLSSSGWLRTHCMDVFHYVAHELRGEPLFDSAVEQETGVGSIYNDFDASSTSLMVTTAECADFSFSQKMQSSPTKTSDAIAEAVDYAVMDADNSEGVLYEHLVWETPLFDNFAESCTDEYLEKVYRLVTDREGCWSELTISGEAEKMFARRFRTNWEAPDSVYDTWLQMKGWERGWFDTHRFSVLYPDVEDEVQQPPRPQKKRTRFATVSSESEESGEEPDGSASGTGYGEESSQSDSDDSSIYSPVKDQPGGDGSSEKSSQSDSDDSRIHSPVKDQPGDGGDGGGGGDKKNPNPDTKEKEDEHPGVGKDKGDPCSAAKETPACGGTVDNNASKEDGDGDGDEKKDKETLELGCDDAQTQEPSDQQQKPSDPRRRPAADSDDGAEMLEKIFPLTQKDPTNCWHESSESDESKTVLFGIARAIP